MDEKSLKTSLKQRIIIVAVALLLLGSTVLTYMFIVMQSGLGKQNSEQRVAELEEQYNAKQAELKEAAKPFSDKYYDEFKTYQSRVKSYNSATANSEKLKIEDIKVGTGREIGDDDTDYQAYYIGWCADGSIFDSSFDYDTESDPDKETPIGLKAPLIGSSSMIEGWLTGIAGMKLGGVRQLTIPGELAYGDTREDICEGKNAPLKFIIMPMEKDDEIVRINEELDDISIKLYTALLGQQN